MRIVLMALVLGACGAGIAIVFWKQQLKYSLPTPVPTGYAPVPVGSRVALPPSLPAGKAHFLHFYSPDCPCSRFNARHIQALLRSFGDSIRFTIVVPSAEDIETVRSTFGHDLAVTADASGHIARACGVYATPQAAIIDFNGDLYYSGNYNRARYCTTRASNFAELALIALLNRQPPPVFGIPATQSYGCELASTHPELDLF